MLGKPRSGLPAWGGAARCSMSGMFWCSAVGTVVLVRPAGQETRARMCSSVALVSVALHSRAFVSPWLARCLLARVGLPDGIESPCSD